MSLSDIWNKVEADPVAALFYAGGAAICAGLGVFALQDRLRKPARPGFENPDVKASREREAALRQKHGFETPKAP